MTDMERLDRALAMVADYDRMMKTALANSATALELVRTWKARALAAEQKLNETRGAGHVPPATGE